MRNKPFPYRLPGWLLLAGLAVALPSGAADIQGECFSSDFSQCVASSKSVDVTFKASFITPSCNVDVMPEVTLPDAVIADFAGKGRFAEMTPDYLEAGEDLATSFDITLSQCDAGSEDAYRFKTLRLTFTDLNTTSSEAGIFAADFPPRDDVGFVIFGGNQYNSNVLTKDITYRNTGSDTDQIYHFAARMQKYSNYSGAVKPGAVVGSVSVTANYE